jgi:group I intron endonuclease
MKYCFFELKNFGGNFMSYKNKVCGIYCIENICNNKKYIGQSVNIYERWSKHRSLLRQKQHRNQHLQSAWDVYGEDNFAFYVIKQCAIEELDELEIYYSDLYNVFDNCYGYNIEPAGRSNHTRSQETIDKIKKNRKYVVSNETRQKISQLQTGRELTDEWKENISRHHRDAIKNGAMVVCVDNLIRYNEQQKRKVDCYTSMGDFICTYESIHEAARDLKIAATNICKVLCNKYRHCNKMVFYEHTGDFVCRHEIIRRVYDCPIFLIDDNNNLVEFFTGYTDAAKKLNIPAGSIRKVCNEQLTHTHGYNFKLATELMLIEYFDKLMLNNIK